MLNNDKNVITDKNLIHFTHPDTVQYYNIPSDQLNRRSTKVQVVFCQDFGRSWTARLVMDLGTLSAIDPLLEKSPMKGTFYQMMQKKDFLGNIHLWHCVYTYALKTRRGHLVKYRMTGCFSSFWCRGLTICVLVLFPFSKAILNDWVC